jgi:hypothetical protein
MINNGIAGGSNFVGGNTGIKTDTIWNIAARNNAKEKQVTYRINGERVSKTDFDKFKAVK